LIIGPFPCVMLHYISALWLITDIFAIPKSLSRTDQIFFIFFFIFFLGLETTTIILSSSPYQSRGTGNYDPASWATLCFYSRRQRPQWCRRRRRCYRRTMTLVRQALLGRLSRGLTLLLNVSLKNMSYMHVKFTES
jgi:hypothetical protein